VAKRTSTRRSAARRTRSPAKGASAAAAKPSLRERIQQQLGDTPFDDSLAAVTWMQRALAVVASDLVESELDDHKKRSEMLKICVARPATASAASGRRSTETPWWRRGERWG
jgi:hypothetical protein